MNGKKTEKLALIILTCNNPALLTNCLACIHQQKNAHIEIVTIVVDNGSHGTNLQKVKNICRDILLITNMKNYGFAKGINYGINLALTLQVDYILTLNDDTQFAPDFIQGLLSQTKKHNLPICGPKIVLPDGHIWSQGGKINTTHYSGGLIGYGQKNSSQKAISIVDFISGTALLVKSEVYLKIGLFDENYFLYYDDVDFCTRARLAGYFSYLVPSVQLTHLETSTIGKNSPRHIYHSTLSHLLYLFKFAPLTTKIRETARYIYYIFFSDREYKVLQLKALASFLIKISVNL